MQPNTIAYTYDHDNDGGTTAAVAVTVTRHGEEVNKTTYVTPTHNLTVQKDTVEFYRTLAKRSGDFLGAEKTAVKRTKTQVVPSAAGLDISAPFIANLEFSVPVGMSEANRVAAVMEHIGFVSSAEGKAALLSLVKQQNI